MTTEVCTVVGLLERRWIVEAGVGRSWGDTIVVGVVVVVVAAAGVGCSPGPSGDAVESRMVGNH